MTATAHAPSTHDRTALPGVLRHAVQLGVLEAILVTVFALGSRVLEGGTEQVFRAAVVIVGVAAVSLLPGTWTRPRTIEGIAGAAGIGLAATVVFLVIDVALLQHLGLYTNRWFAIGGGSNWWYHPVWWMVGTYMPWMGAFAMANLTRRGKDGIAARVAIMTLVLAIALGAAAAVFGFPGARMNLPTFAIACLPALALTVLITGIRRD